jgi:hypothetical protein
MIADQDAADFDGAAAEIATGPGARGSSTDSMIVP